MNLSVDDMAVLTRRAFLRGAGVVAGAAALSSVLRFPVAEAAVPAEDWWLGPELWANRLQDWCVRAGKITCVAPPADRRGRTVALLTKSLNGGAARLSVRTGTQSEGAGFSGFVVGAGEAGTDYRRSAQVLSASGTGGGILCVYGSDGIARFREHTNERDQFAYAALPSTSTGSATPRRLGEQIDLTLDVGSDGAGTVKLTLTALSGTSLLSSAVMSKVDVAKVKGGISLVSSGSPNTGATYWFSNVATEGAGVVVNKGRTLGPIVGVLFGVTGTTLKMTAQVMPMLPVAGDKVTLQIKDPLTGVWANRTSAPIGPGFTALLRVDNWDRSQARDYRVVFSRGGSFAGSIPAEPTSGQLRIATLSCTSATCRSIDGSTPYVARVSGEQPLDLYTSRNMWFPHEQLAAGIKNCRPDLLVAMGDQLYENSPTHKDSAAAPELDFLYKYILWLWSFREITRNTPCIVLVDDHDVFQGNLWGEGGVAVPAGVGTGVGGYVNEPNWVNVVQRVQCGHNPDPVDAAPVAQGITVYFTHFTYAGVDFVLLEDRKFKTGPNTPGADPQLLGPRREAMLADLAANPSGRPRVVCTQTMFACVETNPDGTPKAVKDSAGWPPAARSRALASIKAMGGVMLSGDTHLAALVRHGDGPVQFCGPAGSTTYARWFEPPPLPNAGVTPHTGDYVDGFGNAVTVLAVANPRVTQSEWMAAYQSHGLGDRGLKQEGWGVLAVDLTNRRHTFEAWRYDVNPLVSGAKQLAGWPYVLPFDAV